MRAPNLLVSALVVASVALLVRDGTPDASPGTSSGAPGGPGHEVALPVPGSLAFEPNQGQTDERVRFMARGDGYTMFLTDAGLVARLAPGSAGHGSREAPEGDGRNLRQRGEAGAVIGMTLANANPSPRMTGELRQAGSSNYFIGSDPADWRRHVPRFSRVRHEDVYAGIDALYYGNDGELEYDFVVAPGVDPEVIALDFSGVDGLALDASGDLVLDTGAGELVQQRPVAYQLVDGVRRRVEAAYRLMDSDTVGFALGAFDASLALTIDPVLSYSTYLGGDGHEAPSAVEIDAAGNIWIAGYTSSTVFPWDMAFDSEYGGNGDAYVCRFNPAGDAPTCAYIGGEGVDGALALAIGPDGGAYVAGFTESQSFPTVIAHQPGNHGGADAFVLKIDATSEALEFSTLLGGAGEDYADALAVDASGAAFVAGWTSSTDLAVTPGAFQASVADQDNAFVARFDPSGALGFATFLGGTDADRASDLDLDGSGHAYITGATDSADFPVQSPFQATPGGGGDAFLAKLHRDGGTLIYSTYLGGDQHDEATGVALDRAGRPALIGLTNSYDFPLSRPLYSTLAQGQGEFVTQFNAAGNALVFSTYLDGYSQDWPEDLEFDAAGNLHVAGTIFSSDFPLKGSLVPRRGDVLDGVVMKIGAGGRPLLFSSALSGTDWDEIFGLALDIDGNVYLAGYTESTDFPVASAFQDGFAGGTDVVLLRVSEPAMGHWRGDFNGDGIDDILWRNNATGHGSIWHSANSRTAVNMTRVTNLDWRIVGVGDFNGDGKSDVLWRNARTGANTIWRSGDSRTSQSTTGVTNLNWQVHGVADFDANGSDDIVWHNTATGDTAIWREGASTKGSSLVRVTNLAWDIVGTGDFDGDGVADLLWRDSSSGNTATWSAGDYRTAINIGSISGHAWQIAGVADFEGDGLDDIVWRNAVDGRNTLWANGSSAQGRALARVDRSSWKIVGTGDYNGDGKADLLWRDTARGSNAIWRSANAQAPQAVVGVTKQEWVPKS